MIGDESQLTITKFEYKLINNSNAILDIVLLY
jgi:hypothetical protein